MVDVIVIVVFAFVVIGPIWFVSRRIDRRIEPPDRPDHEGRRFRFPKYGPIPAPGGGPGGGPM
jgi:hypothetical protein